MPAAAPPAADPRQLELRSWQAEALAAWSHTCRGVVEAVTGTGKTRLAMAAIAAVTARGGRTLVLVPTLELQDQWARQLRTLHPDLWVGRLGGGHDDDLFRRHVVVATPHAAADVPVDLPPATPGLLVADEAHRYAAPTWSRALQPAFDLRLALTATYQRNDDGLEEVLAPYFGDVVYRYRYAKAATDGTIAPFRIGLLGVDLSPPEQDAYARVDRRVRQLHRELIGPLGMPRDPRRLLAAAAAVVASAGQAEDGPQARACREYLVRIRERRDIAATAAAKVPTVATLAPALSGRRSLLFADTVEQADAVARALQRQGLRAETLHGKLPADRRRIRLAQFRRHRLDALVAPRVLDEGVDVPDADVAVVVAAFRTRRQMVQRLGRVLRTKPDGGHADLVLLHARGTAEDPARGGHADFLDEVRPVALEVADLDRGERPGTVTATTWLGTCPLR